MRNTYAVRCQDTVTDSSSLTGVLSNLAPTNVRFCAARLNNYLHQLGSGILVWNNDVRVAVRSIVGESALILYVWGELLQCDVLLILTKDCRGVQGSGVQ